MAQGRVMTTSCWVARSRDDIGLAASRRRPKSSSALFARLSRSPTSMTPHRVGFIVEGDVLRDGKVGDDVDFLRHQRDAGPFCFGDAVRSVRASRKGNGPLVAPGGMGAGEDLDERRLAGAVLAVAARQSPGGDREAHIVQRHARRESALSVSALRREWFVAAAVGVGRRQFLLLFQPSS